MELSQLWCPPLHTCEGTFESENSDGISYLGANVVNYIDCVAQKQTRPYGLCSSAG